jgi:isochorismate synthase/2-succinyl-5-enolpyruvyl-6-hydroxy-3-cyclohexene-1-carboxylate synthase/2-succinyl-6-hydroxy-2,4-cyclohexadiene-1-carboxylate synthase/O-succinylbenzoate synthase
VKLLLKMLLLLKKIREVVGYKVNIRVDANKKWTYAQAIEFGLRVKSFSLQYIEVMYL